MYKSLTQFLHTEIQIRVADIDINKSFSHWINDGLMAVCSSPHWCGDWFCYSSVSLTNIQFSDMASVLPIGVALGLFIGKPLGIFSISWFAVRFKISTLPEGVNLKQVFAVSVLCGIGFTMSMFITSLAFTDPVMADLARLGILLGSTLAAVFGYYLLACATTTEKKIDIEEESPG
ncbi:Na+/H+ antiporter NhaA [Moritella yayanosii]|uniref:Na(+)/H(+) antiporter NhaA n=1 Tax=Moritella yayanosii TaxID=69539 RepID=A0A330LRA1_9GAMM